VPAAVEGSSLCLARYKIGSASSSNSSIPETGRLTQPREPSLCIWDAFTSRTLQTHCQRQH
jgi:hypothetical protein